MKVSWCGQWWTFGALGLVTLGVLAAAGCGGTSASPARSEAASPTTTSTTTGYSSGGGAPTAASDESSAGSAPAPASQPASTAPRAAGGVSASQEMSVNNMSYWQDQLEQARTALSTAGGECGDVCRASGNICVAAREICSLTGDGESAQPSDRRCNRARGACEQATRQRNASCPVCPSS